MLLACTAFTSRLFANEHVLARDLLRNFRRDLSRETRFIELLASPILMSSRFTDGSKR